MLDRPVVLKFLAYEVTASAEFKNRFIQEAKAAAVFDHPNICTLYGIEESGGLMFLVMAFVPGKTLKDMIPVQPVDEALRIISETARGLEDRRFKPRYSAGNAALYKSLYVNSPGTSPYWPHRA